MQISILHKIIFIICALCYIIHVWAFCSVVLPGCASVLTLSAGGVGDSGGVLRGEVSVENSAKIKKRNLQKPLDK